jgi:predicted ATPase
MQHALPAYEATGARLWRPHFLALLAGALDRENQTEKALAVATEALAVAESTGEGYSRAELYRLKGELIIKAAVPGSAVEAEACFTEGLKIAQQQGAKSWELRISQSRHQALQSNGC